MQLLKYTLPFLALALCVLGEATASPEVQIEVTHLPSDCVVKAKTGDRIKVHYTGTLPNGSKFDSSENRAPFSLILGIGQVIKGWDEGLQGMCLHEKRVLTIPPELGYGARGSGSIIPPHSTLTFKVELMELDISKRVAEGRDEL